MTITLPIYVEAVPEPGQKEPVFRCRPLFFPALQGRDVNLGRAMNKLIKKLKPQLDQLGQQPRHDELADRHFCPDLKTHQLKLTLDLRDRRVQCKLLFVELTRLGRRVAFTPSVPEVWFEIGRGEDLQARATEVLTEHFRRLAKEADDGEVQISSIELKGRAWVTTLELGAATRQRTLKEEERQFARLFDDQRVDGATELRRVGRCLDWLYPDDLDRAVLREREVAELHRLLAATDRRPVLLVGPRMVGKTTILHEVVRQRVAARRRQYANQNNVWLLSPQRLISGMSFVGKWENRLLAILKHARRRDHVLCFDDIMGLYLAGISAQANLSVADVLRAHVLRREVRVLGEMTPEMLRAFQERDRGLADAFHVLPVEPTGPDETLSTLVTVSRTLEGQTRARFDLDVLPTIIELHERYARDAAFPGKAARFLRQLAVKCPRERVTRDTVFQDFHAKTGLALSLLDDRQKLPREAIVEPLRRRIISQDAAVDAAADVISIAKARLNDRTRPLATLLFLGPTGVGKTHCAKAIAEFLFSDAERIVRFDMNEYVSPRAASQLVGTFDAPEGLLTGAVRRQPFCVVLLDEIEKAHADVFDLLLQVTGEGRLTDSLGRTTDFSNAIIVMTSNLGTREAGRRVGFADAAPGQHEYVLAAERFFRPEFINRIDRLIPFERLGRDAVRRIAELLIQDVFKREGLVRRRTVLDVAPRAMERIIDAGFHPELGARALKRSLERNLTQPVAARLAALPPELPNVVSVFPRSNGLAVEVQPLRDAKPATLTRSVSEGAEPADPSLTLRVGVAGEELARFSATEIVSRARHAVERIEHAMEQERPTDALVVGQITPQQLRYFAIKEQTRRVRRLAARISDTLDPQRRRMGTRPVVSPARRRSLKSVIRVRFRGSERQKLAEIFAADDIHRFLQDMAASAVKEKQVVDHCDELRNEAALLQSMFDSADRPGGVAIVLRSVVRFATDPMVRLATVYRTVFADRFSCECVPITPADLADWPDLNALHASSPFVWPLASVEVGTHLFVEGGGLYPVQVALLPVPPGGDTAEVARSLGERRGRWLDALADDRASVEDDPFPLGPVIRIYSESSHTLDLRSSLSVDQFPSAQQLRTFMLANLSPVPEFLER